MSTCALYLNRCTPNLRLKDGMVLPKFYDKRSQSALRVTPKGFFVSTFATIASALIQREPTYATVISQS